MYVRTYVHIQILYAHIPYKCTYSGLSNHCLEDDCGGCEPLTHCRPCLKYEKVGRYIRVYIYMYIRTSMYCMYIGTYVCVCVCMYVRTCMYCRYIHMCVPYLSE